MEIGNSRRHVARALTYVTQNARPAGLAFAFERLRARSVLTSRQHLAILARRTGPAQAATTLAGRLAIAACLMAITATNRCSRTTTKSISFRPDPAQTVAKIKGQILTVRTEQAVPAFVANALERHVAAAVLAARQRDALIASVAVEAQIAATLARPFAIALHRVAALPADRHVAQVALPTGQTFQIAILVAAIV